MITCRRRTISFAVFAVVVVAILPPYTFTVSFAPQPVALRHLTALAALDFDDTAKEGVQTFAVSRRDAFSGVLDAALLSSAALVMGVARPALASAAAPQTKCGDIDSCREIGERKVEADMRENPTFSLPGGVRYKVLRRPLDGRDGVAEVGDGSSVDLAFSVNAQGAYMYSRGFGYEKVDLGDGRRVSDLGLDSFRVVVGRRDVPVGIERALVGMRRGERRRVEVPPSVGFETSNWEPAPTTRRGNAAIKGYRQILEGRGSSQPPFPASTIWDIEVLKIRN